MTSELAMEITTSFRILKFFPSAEEARLEIADRLRDMCPSAEAGTWVRERVLAKWREWEGPGPLRELLSERFKPADEKPAPGEYESGPPLRYELVTARDGTEGVRLLHGAARLALPPAEETENVRVECVALVKAVVGDINRKVPRPTRIDCVPLPPDPRCTRCLGSGWLLENELRFECTYRQRAAPIALPSHAETPWRNQVLASLR